MVSGSSMERMKAPKDDATKRIAVRQPMPRGCRGWPLRLRFAPRLGLQWPRVWGACSQSGRQAEGITRI